MIMRIITADQAAELDQKAMHDHGISGIELMGSAGQAIADEAREMVAEIHDPKIIIICGKGNNGGDGFAAAACLDGFNVYIYSLIEAKQIVGDAAHFHENCIQKSIDIYYAVDPPEDLSCDLIIDAEWGERVQAFVVSEFQISNFNFRNPLKGKISDFKIPKEFIQVPSIPRNELGKIEYPQLIELQQ